MRCTELCHRGKLILLYCSCVKEEEEVENTDRAAELLQEDIQLSLQEKEEEVLFNYLIKRNADRSLSLYKPQRAEQVEIVPNIPHGITGHIFIEEI